MTARVALVGLNGHGRWHLDNVTRLAATGLVTLVAGCDVAQIPTDTRDAVSALGASLFTSYDEMLDAASPDIVVLVTPPASHRAMTTAAMASGADVLLEKPATVRRNDLEAIVDTGASLGRRCQIGFQSCGSYAIDRIAACVENGELGTVRQVFAAGAWSRPIAYFHRSAWAGRRSLNGTAVGDGAIANPFAHALMNCLQIAGALEGSAATSIEAELFHANTIESDDTSSLRLRVGDLHVNVAVTLCADTIVEPYVVVVGHYGRLRWHYTTDELWFDRAGGSRRVDLPARRDLLVDLVNSRSNGHRPICPPERCREFTTVTEHLLDTAVPAAVGAEHVVLDDPVTIRDVSATVIRAAENDQLFSEAGAPWAIRSTSSWS
jgi:predicted dehydrogenase